MDLLGVEKADGPTNTIPISGQLPQVPTGSTDIINSPKSSLTTLPGPPPMLPLQTSSDCWIDTQYVSQRKVWVCGQTIFSDPDEAFVDIILNKCRF